MNFHYRTYFVKINDQTFQYIKKKLIFVQSRLIFPIFGAKKNFQENHSHAHLHMGF